MLLPFGIDTVFVESIKSLSVRPSVCPAESCFKLSIFIILSTNHHDDFRMTSESIKQAFREHSQNT